MGERTLAIAVAQCPDAGYIGAQLIIDLDEAGVIRLHASLFKAQVVGVGHPPHRHEYMRPCDLRRTHGTMHVGGHRLGIVRELYAFGFESYLNTLCFKRGLDRSANFRILVGQKTSVFLYHGDLAAKSSIHLREFKADVTSADDDQV